MNTPQKVVVNVKIVTIPHPNDDVFIARIPDLALTAYGPTAEQATGSVKRLFSRFVNIHREAGTLEDVLGRAGVTWYPEELYPSDQPRYEDTDLLFNAEMDLPPAVRNNHLNIVREIQSQTFGAWNTMASDPSAEADLMVAA